MSNVKAQNPNQFKNVKFERLKIGDFKLIRHLDFEI
jgi:hypothetical protein